MTNITSQPDHIAERKPGPAPSRPVRSGNKPAKTASTAVVAKSAPTEPGQRPYTLESANLEADLTRQRAAANSELEAIEASILDITARANSDVQAIQARADAEIKGRNDRAADLHRIIAMADRALNPPADIYQQAVDAAEADLRGRTTNDDIAAALATERAKGDQA